MFLVLGLRPGEMFALRWNDKQQNSLRIDSSITDGIEFETKTEGSNTSVWLPASIDTELEFLRSTSERNATLAQLVERLIRNQQVAGSIPAGGSIYFV
jgi:hypothetical protein